MRKSQEVDRITQVNVQGPSALDLSRIIRSQRKHPDRLVTYVYEDSKQNLLHEVLDFRDSKRIKSLIAQLDTLSPETETVGEVIVYTSSSKD